MISRLALAGATLALSISGASVATAHPRHGRNPICPYLEAGDGCVNALPDASFIQPSFAAYATQNGQPSILASHPETWDRPGADYAVGHGLKTPLTFAKNFVAQGGCAYATTGGGINGLTPRILCASSVSPRLDNIDFTDGGTDCTTLEFSNVTGAVIVNNFKMGNSNVCAQLNSWLMDIKSGTPSSVTLSNFDIDGAPPICTLCYSQPIYELVLDNTTSRHTLTMQYFATTHAPGRIANGSGGPTNLIMQYFYIDGFNMGGDVSTTHGEVTLMGPLPAYPLDYTIVSHGVVVTPNTTPIPNAMAVGGIRSINTTVFYLSTGDTAHANVTLIDLDHLTIVTNGNPTFEAAQGHTPATVAPVSYAGFSSAYNTFDQLVFDHVYIDPNGSETCPLTTTSSPPTIHSAIFNAVFDLYDGSAITGFNRTPCPGVSPPPY